MAPKPEKGEHSLNPPSSPNPQKQSTARPAPIKFYLVAYNALSTLGWAYLLLQTLLHTTPSQTLPKLLIEGDTQPLYSKLTSTYAEVGPKVALVQSFAVLEVVHALLGWVRSPLQTTAMQVSSRLYLVWAITERYKSAQLNPLYTTMILSWSITEVIRYSFYAFSLLGSEPHLLTYLRYTTFYVLYPLGAGSEAFLIFATVPALTSLLSGGGEWTVFAFARLFFFVIWWPGLYVMYTYMIAQRRKVLGGASKAKKAQ
ncbi:hypothetical protein AX17_004972 [Amanita inopinata Kibby_2008]|nr:hypothetical protein AX17_004972 [Amanita inopinata Kibby_2008]